MLTKLKDYYLELTSDDSGKISLSKTMLFLGFIFISLYMWKLMVMKEITIEFFVTYIGFISGHQLISKKLDKAGNKIEVSEKK